MKFSWRWLLLFRTMGSRVHGLQQLQLFGCRAQAQKLWHTGLVALQHVGSSWIMDQTLVSCTGGQILYHWTTSEVPSLCILKQNSFSDSGPSPAPTTGSVPAWGLPGRQGAMVHTCSKLGWGKDMVAHGVPHALILMDSALPFWGAKSLGGSIVGFLICKIRLYRHSFCIPSSFLWHPRAFYYWGFYPCCNSTDTTKNFCQYGVWKLKLIVHLIGISFIIREPAYLC